MNKTINRNALFTGSCFALITTAFTFSIRAGVLPQVMDEFGLTAEQAGIIGGMFFAGFPISMILGGLFYHSLGPKNIMRIAFVAHVVGILMTIYAGGYVGLIVSTLLIGFGNGCTEAACNPLIADAYGDDSIKMNQRLNWFHMWFPGGILVGSLISTFMTDAGAAWQTQVWVCMLPAVIYFIIFWGKTFVEPREDGSASISENLKAMGTPIFLFLFFCMILTAVTEFGPNNWISVILTASGASPMLLLALTTGLMALGRFFAGPVVKTFGQTGVLLLGAILGFIGIYMFSTLTGPITYLAAFIFAGGITYFWPVMIGAVAQRAPGTGALGLSVVGGMGMFSSGIAQWLIGGWIDASRNTNAAAGLTGQALELATGQETMFKILIFPGILIVLFTIFFFWQKNSKTVVTAAGHL